MFRVILFLLVVIAAAAGLSWLADRPGSIDIAWQGYEVSISVFSAVIILAVLLATLWIAWVLFSGLFSTPAAIGNFVNRRRQKKGLEALSTGMIAIGAGDESAATRYALQARRSLPNEPMTQLLRAQAAQLSGDTATSRRIFEAMLSSPDTEQLGLRGLYLEAYKQDETEAAQHFAERAVALNPKLGWAVDGLFELQCKTGDWAAALDTVSVARKNGHIEKTAANRRRAVLLTAQAQALEEDDQEKAMNLAIEAHGLAPDLVPAAAITGRVLAARGNTPKATKVVRKTWGKAPHPDLATAYAYARLGDSPRDRLERVKKLAAGNPYSLEAPIAIATAAIEAKAYDEARSTLAPLLKDRLTQRICTLMARIENEDGENKGLVREWLARAVTAPKDPAWTADGVVSNSWQPTSPVTGTLDAFQWRVPVEVSEKSANDLLAQKLEELVALSAPEKTIEAKSVSPSSASAQSETGESDAMTAKKGDAADLQTATPIPAAERARTTPAQNTHRAATSETEAKQTETPVETKTQGNGHKSNAAKDLVIDISETEQAQTAPTAATEPSPQPTTTSKSAEPETKFFVSPRAPDDPGPKQTKSKPKRDPSNPYRRITS